MPKIIGDSLQEHRAATRQRLFDALASLLAERSLDTITMAQLASRAGIGRTAIYNHFADKEAVVVEFATAETQRFLATLDEALAGAETPLDRLRTYVRHHIASQDEFHLNLGHQVTGSLSVQALKAMRSHVIVVQAALAGIIQDGIASGDFVSSDVQSTVALVHACLTALGATPAETEGFVLRALSPGA